MKLIIISALLVLVQSNYLFAQDQFQFSEQSKDERGQLSFVKLADNTRVTADVAKELQLLEQVCKPNGHISFKLERNYNDDLGYIHQVYRAYFENIEIIDASFVIHAKNNVIKYANGNFENIDNLSTTPSITSKQAINNAINYFSTSSNDIASAEAKSNGLVFCRDILNNDLAYYLAYQVFVESGLHTDAQYLYVNANTGNIINKEGLVCTGRFHKTPTPNANAVGETLYTGVQNFVTDAYSGQFRLREVRTSVNILTLNANHQTDKTNIVNTATDFTDNDNNWHTSEHQADRVALDAHWGAEKVVDYWKTVHNRNSIDNAGMNVINYIHYSTGYDNALWDKDKLAMFYGDGSSIFKPLASLDVCAHELGHGICQFTSNLTYSGESGALNEGFSDIWGASVETWAAPNKQRWLIGEEITNPYPYYLRSMNNPNSGYNAQPDTYHGTYWASTSGSDYGGVHTNSGVLNYWFYLLAQGGSGTNDNSNSFSVSGVGIDHASKIAYRTEQLLNSSANFIMARTMSIQAARDLYGIGSCDEIAVVNAWYAVGIGNPFSFTLTVTGNDVVCSTSGNYTISNLPTGASVTWQASPTGIVTINSPNSPQTTITKITNGVVTLTATTSTCGNQFIGSKQVTVGLPTTTNIAGLNPPLGVSPGELLELDVLEGGPSYSYLWTVEGGTISGYNNQQHVTILVDQCSPYIVNGYINVHVTITNSCGTGSTYTEWTTVDCSTGGGPAAYKISPNPSNGMIAIDGQTRSIKEIKISDKMGNIKKQIKFSGADTKVTIDISTLSADIYYLQVFDGKTWEGKQISIRR